MRSRTRSIPAVGIVTIRIFCSGVMADVIYVLDRGAMEFGLGPCPGDTDTDRDVDLADLATLLTQFGSTGTDLAADLDDDRDVDLNDLAILLSRFGRVCP